jgi:hypothetical protein
MRAFKIGYVLTLSFLLVLMVVTLTFGFFPAPSGPKAPTYPSSSSSSDSLYGSSSSSSRSSSSSYYKELQQYETDKAKYDKEQKNFVKDKVVPYTQGVFISWIVILLIFQIAGLLIAKFWASFIGAAYSFSGVWAVIFGPLGGLIWFASSLVSSFSGRAEETFSVDPILQGVGLTCLFGVALMTAAGIFFYGRRGMSGSSSEPLSDSAPEPQTSDPSVAAFNSPVNLTNKQPNPPLNTIPTAPQDPNLAPPGIKNF